MKTILLVLFALCVGVLVFVITYGWLMSRQRRCNMKVTEFAREVTLREGLNKSVSIAQVLEILKIVNTLLNGDLYKLIRNLK